MNVKGEATDATKQYVQNKDMNESSSDNSKSSRNSSNSTSSSNSNNSHNESSRHSSHRRSRRKPVDVLHFLGTCSNGQLMIVVFAFRIFAVIFMSFCHRILPLLFGLDSLVFDTCQELYDDTRFAFLRNWDAVHFYHIAQHGYSHDNVCAFFPFVPMIIRAVSCVTSPEVLPFLRVIAPVSLYVTLINITASCLSAVVLRNLTQMTFLESQDKTHGQYEWTNEQNDERTSQINIYDDVKIVTESTNRQQQQQQQQVEESSEELPSEVNGNESQTTNEIIQQKEELCKNGTWLASIKSESHSHNLSEEHVKEDSRNNYSSSPINNATQKQSTMDSRCERLSASISNNNNNNSDNSIVNNKGHESNGDEFRRTRLVRNNGEDGALLDRFAAMTFALRESSVWQSYMKYEDNKTGEQRVALCENVVKGVKEDDTEKRTAEAPTNAHKANKEYQQQQKQKKESFTFVQTGQRIVGGALLMWIISPAMIFTVVNYTESLFALFTMYGIYLINRAPPFVRKGMFSTSTALTEIKTSKLQKLYTKLSMFAMYVCALSSKEELFATLCFVIACSIRSNAILCGGFLLYPMFLALVFPREYARRYRLHLECSSSSDKVKHTSSYAAATTTKIASVWSLPPVFVLCRIAVLVMECTCITIPYLLLNYHCWRTFAHTWSLEEQAKMSNGKFFRFYSLLQHRYWNVGFLTSYTIANLPNVLLALPITTLIFHGMELFYIRPIVQLWLGKESTQKMLSSLRKLCDKIKSLLNTKKSKKSGEHVEGKCVKVTSCAFCTRAMLKTWSAMKEAKERTSCFFLSLYELIGLLTQSCNVVYLCALTFIALTMMHIQVSTRFLSSCPAVYWFAGLQLALYPTSCVSRLLIAYCAIYELVGGVLFANHMPWT